MNLRVFVATFHLCIVALLGARVRSQLCVLIALTLGRQTKPSPTIVQN